MAAQTASTASFHHAADPQLSSPLFSLLPAEIRSLIYLEFWHLCNPRQHIVLSDGTIDPNSGELTRRWSHAPCITDPCTEDVRLERLPAREALTPGNKIWVSRLRSDWCLHWACEEGDPSQLSGKKRLVAADREGGDDDAPGTRLQADEGVSCASPSRSGFLDVLRTCKRMYFECLPSLYGNITFVFTDTGTTEHFLSRYGSDTGRYPLRSLELCIRATNILTEVYYPPAGDRGDDGPPAIFAGTARPGLSMQNNPWQRACDSLVKLPNLQDIRIWFDSSDLRPWHKRVSETRFFGKLFDVRVPDKSRFVLALPELPDRRGPDSQALAGHYLEGEKMENAPFTVERGPRPNNWRIHLRNIASLGAYAS